jgi:hypothetical protein
VNSGVVELCRKASQDPIFFDLQNLPSWPWPQVARIGSQKFDQTKFAWCQARKTEAEGRLDQIGSDWIRLAWVDWWNGTRGRFRLEATLDSDCFCISVSLGGKLLADVVLCLTNIVSIYSHYSLYFRVDLLWLLHSVYSKHILPRWLLDIIRYYQILLDIIRYY